MKIHDPEEKKHQCDECANGGVDRKFRRRHDLARHIRVVHRKIGSEDSTEMSPRDVESLFF